MLQFRILAPRFVRHPAGEAQTFTPLRPPRACCQFGHKWNNGLQKTSLRSCPFGWGTEKTNRANDSDRHMLGGKGGLGDVYFVEWRSEFWVGTTMLGVDLARTVLTFVAALFVDFHWPP